MSEARQLEHFENLVSLFFTRAEEKGDAPFLWAKRDGEWRPITWTEAALQVAALAASLKRIGLESNGSFTFQDSVPIQIHNHGTSESAAKANWRSKPRSPVHF